jgi:hypothetical protein
MRSTSKFLTLSFTTALLISRQGADLSPDPPPPPAAEIKNKGEPEDEKKGEKDHVEDREGRRKDQYQILPEQDQHNSKLKQRQ